MLKKLIAKKCDSMFPSEKPPSKKVKLVVEDADNNNNLMMGATFDKTLGVSFKTKLETNQIAPSRTDSSMTEIQESPTAVNKNSYSYMMEQLSKQIKTLPYVRRDPDFENRRERFFNEPRDQIENDLIHEAMHAIGFFQLEENDLSHLKAMKTIKEQNLKVKGQKEAKRRQSLQLP